jgi:PhnB protein
MAAVGIGIILERPLSATAAYVLIKETLTTRPLCARAVTLHLLANISKEDIMSKVAYIPKDYNTVTPYLVIQGAAQAIEYYKKVFGATETVRMPGPDGKIGHAELKIGNSIIMLADENPSMGQGHTSAATIGASPVSLYVYLPNVDDVVKRAAAEGAKILRPVQDQFYGDRNGFIQDPFGHLWGIATHVEDVSPKDMEERMKKMAPAA